MKLGASDQIDPRFGLLTLLGGTALLLLMMMIMIIIMTLGITATIISIHDRHEEIVDELRTLNKKPEAWPWRTAGAHRRTLPGSVLSSFSPLSAS